MFIQLTNFLSSTPLFVNAERIDFMRPNGDGSTELVFGRSAQTVLESPGVIITKALAARTLAEYTAISAAIDQRTDEAKS